MSDKEDCFHVGVKALIRNKEGKLLLLEKERRNKQTFWDLPGGRLQMGESALETLQREIEEEIGVKDIDGATVLSTHLTNVRISNKDTDVGLIISLYTFDRVFDFTPQLSDEHCGFNWFTMVDAIQILEKQYPLELLNSLKKTI